MTKLTKLIEQSHSRMKAIQNLRYISIIQALVSVAIIIIDRNEAYRFIHILLAFTAGVAVRNILLTSDELLKEETFQVSTLLIIEQKIYIEKLEEKLSKPLVKSTHQ